MPKVITSPHAVPADAPPVDKLFSKLKQATGETILALAANAAQRAVEDQRGMVRLWLYDATSKSKTPLAGLERTIQKIAALLFSKMKASDLQHDRSDSGKLQQKYVEFCALLQTQLGAEIARVLSHIDKEKDPDDEAALQQKNEPETAAPGTPTTAEAAPPQPSTPAAPSASNPTVVVKRGRGRPRKHPFPPTA